MAKRAQARERVVFVRTFLSMAALLFCCLIGGRPAFAHDAVVSVIFSLVPAVASPGQVVGVNIALVDAYFSPIPQGKVSVAFVTVDGPMPPTTPLQEKAEGVYVGRLQLPDSELVIVRIDAILQDGLWTMQFPISVGPKEAPVSEMGVALLHSEESGGGRPGQTMPGGSETGPATQGSGAQPSTPATAPQPHAGSSSLLRSSWVWWTGGLVVVAFGAAWSIGRGRSR